MTEATSKPQNAFNDVKAKVNNSVSFLYIC